MKKANKKMKTINAKILQPYLITILLLPCITILLFNISMRLYMEKSSRQELSNTVKGMEIMIKQQLIDGFLDEIVENNNPAVYDKLLNLRSAIRLTRLAENTDFFILSATDKVLFPYSYDDSFMNSGIINKASSTLINISDNEIVEFNLGTKKYYAAQKHLSNRNRSTRLVFISNGSSAKGFVQTVIIILLTIMITAAGISSYIAYRISKSISRPITRLAEGAKSIGHGDFIRLEDNTSSAELQELTSNMNEMSERLNNYDQVQKKFLQNASHELRTPLMSIQGYAEGIAEGVFTDTRKTALIICEESKRLNSLVEELLTLSRIENKSYSSEMTVINLSDITKEYVQKIHGYAIREKKSINLHIQNEKIPVKIDDNLLAQAIINITSNCIQYARSEVNIYLYSTNSEAVIKIADDGMGIDQNDLPHIFDRFYKGKKGNFGLGLSIALSIVEYMGGKITAYNLDGAVFEIQLPLAI
jgi:signal transduction histidine kinase